MISDQAEKVWQKALIIAANIQRNNHKKKDLPIKESLQW